MVVVDDLLSLLGVVDLFAEHVDRRGHPSLVQLRCGRDGVVDLLAGDVAIGDPPDDRTRNRRQQMNERAVEKGQAAAILEMPRACGEAGR